MWSLNFYMCQNHHDLIFISFSEMLLFIVYFQEPFPPWINPFFFKFCPPILELRPHEQVTESMNNEKRHLYATPMVGSPVPYCLLSVGWRLPCPLGRAQTGILLVLVQCLELTVTVELSSHTPSLLWVENSQKHAEKGLWESWGSSMKISREGKG